MTVVKIDDSMIRASSNALPLHWKFGFGVIGLLWVAAVAWWLSHAWYQLLVGSAVVVLFGGFCYAWEYRLPAAVKRLTVASVVIAAMGYLGLISLLCAKFALIGPGDERLMPFACFLLSGWFFVGAVRFIMQELPKWKA